MIPGLVQFWGRMFCFLLILFLLLLFSLFAFCFCIFFFLALDGLVIFFLFFVLHGESTDLKLRITVETKFVLIKILPMLFQGC